MIMIDSSNNSMRDISHLDRVADAFNYVFVFALVFSICLCTGISHMENENWFSGVPRDVPFFLRGYNQPMPSPS